MAYINAQDVKAIREALKAEFGKTYKFGVTRDNHSGVRITFKKGPAFEKAMVFDRYEGHEKEVDTPHEHAQIPHVIHTFMVKTMQRS